jgi:hypothetical protein
MYNEQIDNRVEQPVQSAPNSAVPTEPSLFTQSDVLHFVNCRKWARFVSAFAPELHAVNLTVPDPDHLNGHDIYWFARFFGNSRLPENLRKALITLETAADPANEDRLYSILTRRFPQDNFGHLHPLDRALELWFNAREELAPFQPNPPASATEAQTSTNPLAPSGTEGNHHEDGESQSGMNNHEQNPAPANLLGNPIENHVALPDTNALVENGNTIPVETPNPPSAEPQSQIENQKSNIVNPSDEEEYHSVWSHMGKPPPPPESDQSVVDRLAPLAAFDYDRVRKFEASKLNIRVEVLDREVLRRQNELRDEREFQAVLATLYTPEPWPEPVDAPAVFDEISSRFKLYLVLPPGAADVFALWAGQTHVFRAFDQTPRLNLYSPVSGCGKTTAMELLSTFVPRAVRTENLRAAVIFRLVHSCQPTLLLDELDTYLAQEEELRGILNAGHRRGATVYRCKGEVGFHKYQAFAPAALAGIGNLPATLHNRSIQIRLTKAKPGELPAHFTSSNIETETLLARKLARWAQDNFEPLKKIRPVLPPNAYNRLGDNWRPLFAIAEAVGGDWPARALAAFNHLTDLSDPAMLEATPELLLADIRQVFADTGLTRIRSRQLLALLWKIPDRSWLTAGKNKGPISEMWLASQLARFGITSHTFRFDGQAAKGYLLTDFGEAFAKLEHVD